MRRLHIIDILISAGIIALIAFILAPAVARISRPAVEAKCQSNLHIWAQAFAAYAADNSGKYPTNRRYLPGGVLSNIIPKVDLSTETPGTPPVSFQFGPNWVEALYPYLQQVTAKTDRDWKSFRACPNTSGIVYPPTATNACVSYTLNICLVESWPGVARDPSKLMMLRELDRRIYSAQCRPMTDCSFSATMRPYAPFLSPGKDPYFGTTTVNPNRHQNGSYVAFVDGHVRYFTTDYYPTDLQLTTANSWDTELQQWFNYGNGSKGRVPDNLIRSIAITP